MMRRALFTALSAASLIVAAGCSASNSSDPLSPSIAGPIAGVNISAPRVMVPASGTRVAVDQQPVTLTIGNAATSGVRPLSYTFEIATETTFTNKVFTQAGVTPGDTGQTSLRLPNPLDTGRTYFWHARAEDGANSGPFTTPADFTVFTPVVFQAPSPIAPINNKTVDSLRPTFSFANASRTGPAGAVSYLIELADSDSFSNKTSATIAEQQGGTTSIDTPQDLPAGKQLFWHVRASDPTTIGPWSSTQVFQTPVPAAPAPPGGGGGGGGGGGSAAADMMNLNLARVYNSPSDIASWPATVTIQQLTMSPSTGLSFTFSSNWPDYTPAGWSGSLQYTVWAVVNISGQWYTSGFIEMWRTRGSTGAPILSDFAKNWAYDARWGPMMGYQPRAGEQMGFFLSAGDARGVGTVTSVRERSNVVVVSLPAGDSGSFPFRLDFRRFP